MPRRAGIRHGRRQLGRERSHSLSRALACFGIDRRRLFCAEGGNRDAGDRTCFTLAGKASEQRHALCRAKQRRLRLLQSTSIGLYAFHIIGSQS